MRLPFQRKLALAFLVMILPLVAIGVYSLRSFRREMIALKTLEKDLERRTVFAELENTLYRQVRMVLSFLVSGNPRAREEFTLLTSIAWKWMAAWESTITDSEEARLTQNLKGLYRQVLKTADRIFRLYDQGEREVAIQIMQKDLQGAVLPNLSQTIAEIYRINRIHGFQRAFEEVKSIGGLTRAILATAVIASTIVGVLFSVLISRSLARPIEELKRAMDIVGEGRWDYRIEVHSNDEIGDLAQSFWSMIEKLKETQTRLIQSEKLAFIGQMSAAVAHGLRNPLASIRVAAQLSLYRLPPTAPVREQLQAIITEVDRLERRIDHLLDFTKPVSHRPVLENVNRLVEHSLHTIAEKLKERGIRLEVEFQEDLPEARFDPSQIEQAVLEVISNAMEAMPQGGVLRITTRGHDDVVEIVVEDTGEGIPEEILPRVFEPFFTTKADGSGLGLAVAKRFIDQNGGTLTITSQVGQGTSVRIILPAALRWNMPMDEARTSETYSLGV